MGLYDDILVEQQTAQNNNIWDELEEAPNALNKIKNINSVRMEKAKRSMTINGKMHYLNNEEYSNFQRDYGKINHNLRRYAFENKLFSRMQDGEITKYLSDINNSALQAVRIMQLGDKPKKYHRYTQSILSDYENWVK